MEVILQKEVENLGNQYELVKVKPGYARNFLIPRGLAIAATTSSRKELTEIIKQRAHKQEKLKKDAESLAVKLKDAVLKIAAKAGENGKIFGSVNAIQLAEAIEKLGYKVDRKNIDLKADHIKTTGTYKANVKLTKDITAEVTFEVVAE
jgi:large subunit ribosomal protein L9